MIDEKDVSKMAEAVKGIVEAVPVYKDALQPAAKEVGTSLLTIAKAVNVALAPVGALVWGFDRIRDYLTQRLAQKLSSTPTENIQSPSAHLAGPAIEALRFTGEEPDLREMYASLLAAAMDKRTSDGAHPSFVETIKQLSADEAKILRVLSDGAYRPLVSVFLAATEPPGQFIVSRNQSMLDIEAEVTCPKLVPGYLDNLCRLGLTEIPDGKYIASLGAYEQLENHPAILETLELAKQSARGTPTIERGFVRLTDLGKQFIEVCVIEHIAQ